MADFPESLDVFVARDGGDDIASTDPNTIADIAEATQAFVGAMGFPISWTQTLVTLVAQYKRGFSVNVDGGTLTVKAGEIGLANSDNSKFSFRRNAADVNIGSGNLDVGSLAATQYFVYAYAPTAATTAPVIFSTSPSAPSGIGTSPFQMVGWFDNAAPGSLTSSNAGSVKAHGEPNIVSLKNETNLDTASTSFGDASGIILYIYTDGNSTLRVLFNGPTANSGTNRNGFQIVVDGTAIFTVDDQQESGIGNVRQMSLEAVVPVAQGVHEVKLQWKVSAGTGYLNGGTYPDFFIVEEK